MEGTFDKNIDPANHELRLKAHGYFDILNELPDGYFINLARIIAAAFNANIALVSLSVETETYFKDTGLKKVRAFDPEKSHCSLAFLDPDPAILPPILKEPCLLHDPVLVGNFGFCFYARAPIVTKEGFDIGAVCVVGKEPREFNQKEKDLLVMFAENALHEIEVRSEMRRMA